jgi:hypothetical protein
MSLGTDLTFIEKWHRDIIWLLLVILATFSAIYIKDKWHSEVLAKQEQEIASLNTDYVKLQAAKNTADNVSQSALAAFNKEHDQIIKLLNKKAGNNNNNIIAPLPTIPTPTDLKDCQEEVLNLQKDDGDCITTVNTLQGDMEISDKLISTQKEIILSVDVENTQLAKDVETQTTRKKLWRDSALGELGLILLHFLL